MSVCDSELVRELVMERFAKDFRTGIRQLTRNRCRSNLLCFASRNSSIASGSYTSSSAGSSVDSMRDMDFQRNLMENSNTSVYTDSGVSDDMTISTNAVSMLLSMNCYDSSPSFEYFHANSDYLSFEEENSTDADFRKLMLQGEKLFQLSKAVQMSEGKLTPARLEAIRLLLNAEMTLEAMIEERRCRPLISDSLHIGSVNVTEIAMVTAMSSRKRKYFICYVMCQGRMFHSEVVEPDRCGFVEFGKNFCFAKLPTDFKMQLKIFSLVIRKRRLLCGIPSLNRSRNSPARFELFDEVEIDLSHIKYGRCITFLGDGEAVLLASVTTVISPSIKSVACVDLSIGDCLSWRKRWCYLDGSKIRLCLYPTEQVENQTMTEIDLRNCERIKNSGSLFRSNTIVLKHEGRDVYLSFGTRKEYDYWTQTIDELIETILVWQQQGCHL